MDGLLIELKFRAFYSLLVSLISAASLFFGWATGIAFYIMLAFSGIWFVGALAFLGLYKQAKALEGGV